MANPALVLPDALQAMSALKKAAESERVPYVTHKLIELRARQINGCSFRVEMHPVPDAVYDEAARHYDEKALAALILSIATINVWNRLNVTVRQVGGASCS